MELKRMGVGMRVVLAALLAALLVGYEALVVVHLVTAGDLTGLLSPTTFFAIFFVMFVLIITVALCGYAWLLPKRGERLRALGNRDPAVVYTAPTQPDRALALRAGESLRIAYHRSRSAWLQIPLFMVLCILFAAGGEVLIFTALPVFGRSNINPLYLAFLYPNPTTATSPTLLDWLAAVFPLAFSALCLVAVFWSAATESSYILLADDQGVTIRRSFRRRFIPWNDILLFARTSSDINTGPVGAYMLWGRSHALPFSIASSAIANESASTRRSRPTYRFEDGYEAYLGEAQRLLATIAARSYAPMLAMREAPLVAGFRRRAPVTTTSEEDARVLPLAGQEYQPRVDDSSASLAYGEQIAFQARLAALPAVGESLLWMAVLGLVTILFVRQPYFFDSLFALGPIVGFIAVAFCVAFLGLAAIALTIQRRRNRQPVISVDALGITGKARGEQRPVTIPWPSVTAWVVVPPPAGSNKPVRYIVFGDGRKITWVEPADARLAGRSIRGDRREAYRERAARVHALIAAHTGLPLRELRADAVPVGQA